MASTGASPSPSSHHSAAASPQSYLLITSPKRISEQVSGDQARPGLGGHSGQTTITDLHLVEVRWSRVPAPATCHLQRLQARQSTRGTWLQCCSAAVPLQSGHRDKFKAFLGTPARARLGASCRPPPHFCVCMQTAGWRLQRLWSAAAL